MLTLNEELEKLCSSGVAMCGGFVQFFMYLPDMVSSLFSTIAKLIAREPWDGQFDDSIVTVAGLFRQSFSASTPESPVAPWIRAIPYRRYYWSTYWKEGSPAGELGVLEKALESPFTKEHPNMDSLDRSDYERVGFTAPIGSPWLRTQHGVQSLENLVELLLIRLPIGSVYRRGAGNLDDVRRSTLRRTISRLYGKGSTAIPDFTGNGYGFDSKMIYYEDFGAVENVLVTAFAMLAWNRSGQLLNALMPSEYKRGLHWKYYTCCTGHTSSLDRAVTTVSFETIHAASTSWLSEASGFYSPGWYNTRSVALSFGSNGKFEYVLAKNIWSVVNVGYTTLAHNDYDGDLDRPTFVAVSKKRDWGDHFTSWPGILDNAIQLAYFPGAKQNAFVVPPGVPLATIKSAQNDLWMWLGPQSDDQLTNGCSEGHHMSVEQKACNVCAYGAKYKAPTTFSKIRALYPVLPQSAPDMAIALLDPPNALGNEITLTNWLALFVFGRYNWWERGSPPNEAVCEQYKEAATSISLALVGDQTQLRQYRDVSHLLQRFIDWV